MACMTGAERRKRRKLVVGSWCYFAMLFNICLRVKDRVIKNLAYVCVCAQVRGYAWINFFIAALETSMTSRRYINILYGIPPLWSSSLGTRLT
jgi:hypothetical protein